MTINHEQIDDLQRDRFRILRWDEDVNRVQKYDFETEQFIQWVGVGGFWHRHPEIEITYVSGGQGLRMVGSDTQEISDSKCIVLLGSGLPHYWRFNGCSSGICVQLSGTRIGELIDEASKSQLNDLFEHAKRGLEFEAGQAEKSVEVLQELTSPSHNRIMRFGLLFQLLGELCRTSVTSKRLSNFGFQGSRSMTCYSEVQQVIAWVVEHFKSPIQLQDAVDLVGMSRASFCRHFSASTGTSFANFVNDIRVSNACRMLYDTDKSIAAIALESGFSNLSNFNRVFLKRKGITPSKFRKSARQ